MLLPSYFPRVGGAEIQLARLCAQLRKIDCCPYVVTRHLPNTARREIIDGTVIIRIGSENTLWWALTAFIYLFFHAKDYDVLHVHGLNSQALVGGLINLIQRKPTVVKTRIVGKGRRESDFSLINRIRMLFLSKRMCVWISLNDQITTNLRKFGIPSSRIEGIPNGFLKQSSATRNYYAKGDGRPLKMLFVGRLEKRKRVDWLIDLSSRLIGLGYQHECVVIGDGSQFNALQQKIYRSSPVAAVKMVGELPSSDVVSFMMQSDILVHPSSAEGFSNTIGEAMSVGLPVLSTRVGAATEIINNGENGFLFSTKHELERLCVEVYEGRYDLRSIGRKAERKILQEYGIGSVASKYKEIYERLCGCFR